MRIAIVSDTHCPDKVENLPPQLLEKLKNAKIDYLIHAGDITSKKVIKKLRQVSNESTFVKGNMDDLDLPQEEIIDIKNTKFLVIHGNDYSRQSLKYRALEKDVDVLVTGHTHSSYLEEGEVLILNPGSTTVPKYEKPGFLIGDLSSDFTYRRITLY